MGLAQFFLGLECPLIYGDYGAYLGLTIVLPITLLALASLFIAFVSALIVALSLGRAFKGVLFLLTLGFFFLVLWGVGRLWSSRAPRSFGLLSRLIRGGAGPDALGHKAHRLGIFAAHGPVLDGFVLTSSVFLEAIQGKPKPGDVDTLTYLESLPVSSSCLRALLTWAQGAGGNQFLIRSSFGGEDGGDPEGLGYPGVFESVLWDRRSGHEALREALIQVWSSRWQAKAAAYGPLPPVEEGRVACLVVPFVEPKIHGVGASVDTQNGDGLHQLIEGGGGFARHSLRTGVVEAVPGFTKGALEDGLVRRLAGLLIRGESLFGAPVEMEWALSKEDRLLIHQVRPLGGLPKNRALLNDGPVTLPSHPLTPLSRTFFFDNDTGAFPSALRRLGAGTLGPEALVSRDGMTYVDVAQVKALMAPTLGPRGLLRLVCRALALGLTPPSLPGPPRGGRAIDTLRHLRDTHIRPLITRQMALSWLMARAPGWLLQGHKEREGTQGGSRFELLGAHRSQATLGAYPWFGSLVVRREWLSDAIEVTMGHARSLLPSIGASLGLAKALSREDMAFFEIGELSRSPQSGVPGAEVLQARRRAYASAMDKAWPPVLLEGEDGQPLDVSQGERGPGLRGFPLGGGVVEGIIHRGGGAPPGSILLLEDGNARGFERLLEAAGVIFARGGALSHLALLCRERGIPGVVGAWEALDTLQTGDRIRLDGQRGEVLPLGRVDVL